MARVNLELEKGRLDSTISTILSKLYTNVQDIESCMKPRRVYRDSFYLRFSYFYQGGVNTYKSLKSMKPLDAQHTIQQVITYHGYLCHTTRYDTDHLALESIRVGPDRVRFDFDGNQYSLGYNRLPKTSMVLSNLISRWYAVHKNDPGINRHVMEFSIYSYANYAGKQH